MEEGKFQNSLFFIKKGIVKTFKRKNNREVLLSTLKAGDVFGEVPFFMNQPSDISAVADSDVDLIAFPDIGLFRSMEDFSSRTEQIIRSLIKKNTSAQDKITMLGYEIDLKKTLSKEDQSVNVVYTELKRLASISYLLLMHSTMDELIYDNFIINFSEMIGKTGLSCQKFIDIMIEFEMIHLNQNDILEANENNLKFFINSLNFYISKKRFHTVDEKKINVLDLIHSVSPPSDTDERIIPVNKINPIFSKEMDRLIKEISSTGIIQLDDTHENIRFQHSNLTNFIYIQKLIMKLTS